MQGAITDNLKRFAASGQRGDLRWRRLAPLVDRELQRLAASILSRYDSPASKASIEPAELVNEFYLKLLRDEDREWESRDHFYAYASAAMRAILIDRHRARQAGKRPPRTHRHSLDELTSSTEPAQPDIWQGVELRMAMRRLQELSPRQAQIVDLKFFAGLDLLEIAATLDLSERTVRRDWIAARAFLYAELLGTPQPESKS